MELLSAWYRELKRRKVLRVAAAYAVAAWAVIEVAETVFPILLLPEWLVPAVTVLAVLGFPVVVALAWAFDATEAGLVRDGMTAGPAEDGAEGVGPSRPRAPMFWAVIGLTLGALAAWTLLGDSDRDVDTDRSVAVLPFENISGLDENEFFSDGMTEDILTNLSQISGLRVISRTSAMTYKGSDKTIPQIARELDVSYVLEGSVRRAEDRVRISAQLIHASTDRHLWARTYDRELTDIFQIQSEIARAIAGELQTELSAAEQERIESQPTEDLAAYDQYLKGRALLDQRTESGMRLAIDHFQRAIARDSGYALAWAGLADAVSLLSFYDYPIPDSVPGALDAGTRAVELDPSLGQAHASLGIAHSVRREGPAALRHLERAIELAPGYAEPYAWLGWVHLMTGNPAAAVPPGEEAVRQDPLAPAFHVYLGEAYLANGDPEAALDAARTAIRLQPDYGLAHFMEALALYHLGRYTAARASLERARPLVPEYGTPTQDEISALMALSHISLGDSASARSILQRINPDPGRPDAIFSAGLVRAALGETDAAFQAFERVEDWGPFSNDHIRYFFPERLADLRADPRYLAIIERVDQAWGLP